jgi:hypothetical protein
MVADEELSTEIVKFAQGRTLTSTEFDEVEFKRAPLVSVNVAVIA